ncbi:Amuc_1100 family pilus-like protein [Roseimicrobium sp. ORNL1]|uniref:Amuc_1100 family pilus-like protein n=1 Tax=Roseimicrobium sp. ORNL1 TaxID=2711231 RepID=UPI0013E1FA82|nr:Amuc_1100 family pilus-like protein [Roseimicrobium sp. ORNL1]QIF04507.1 hypothetical protein G5S37_24255 [Roseimicrobium sp. ORNL1]
MNWVQENKSLAGILGVMIAGILGLGAWLYLSYSEYSTSMEDWNKNNDSIASLKGKKVFPSKENSEAREAEVSAYGDKVDLLRSALLSEKVQQPVKPMSQTEFQAKLKERATAVVQMAKSADIALPADFALGFADYTNNVPRSPEVAAELGVHLEVMERLITTLLQSGVKSVELFERTKLPNEDRPVEPKPTAANRKPAEKPKKKDNKSKSKRTAITEEQAAEPVLDRYPVKMIVTTDQTPFQNIVNTLCDPVKMPHFLVVRLVRVENERQDGPSREEITRKKNPEVSIEQSSDPTAPGGAAASKVAPDAVTIMGEEKLKVYLEVDYVRFRKPASATEEATEVSSTAATVNP